MYCILPISEAELDGEIVVVVGIARRAEVKRSYLGYLLHFLCSFSCYNGKIPESCIATPHLCWLHRHRPPKESSPLSISSS